MLAWDDYYMQAIVAVAVITDPIGKSVFLLLLTKDTPKKRVQSAATVCITEIIHADTQVAISDQSLKLKDDLERVRLRRGRQGIVWEEEATTS